MKFTTSHYKITHNKIAITLANKRLWRFYGIKIFRSQEERFLSKLEDYLSEKEADRVLRTMIDWGWYAEIFAYDFNTGILSLENPGISDFNHHCY